MQQLEGYIMLFQLDEELWFPDPQLADEDGLLAIGGDLAPERLLLAYHNGIFPWYDDDTPILWYSPHERCVLFPDRIKVSKSQQQVIRSGRFIVTKNKDFVGVIQHCAATKRKDQPGTWITDDMQKAYIQLHAEGHAASVEVWQDGALVGGLYGVEVNKIFCGESMFSLVSNASKTALAWLCKNNNYTLIDCQLPNDHLLSLGAEMINREAYMSILQGE